MDDARSDADWSRLSGLRASRWTALLLWRRRISKHRLQLRADLPAVAKTETVPRGATTAKMTVATNGGTVASKTSFTVNQAVKSDAGVPPRGMRRSPRCQVPRLPSRYLWPCLAHSPWSLLPCERSL